MRKEKEGAGKRRFLKKYDGLKYGWLKETKKFLLLLVILFIVFHNLIVFSFVQGHSMEPTLIVDKIVL